MSTAVPMLFNALNGAEVKEIILRKVRENFEQDTRFRQHTTYPNLKFTFTLSMSYEPGVKENSVVTGNADLRAKLQAQADVITRLQEEQREQNQKVEHIETQAGILISDLEKTQRDLADANEFIKKLMSEKHAQPAEPEQVFDLEALANGEPMTMSGESEVLDEPDRLREEGKTEPEVIEITMGGGGEAVGEAVSDEVTIGKPPGAVVLADDTGKTYSTRDIQPARGVTLSANKPGQGAVVPGAVKGRPRG